MPWTDLFRWIGTLLMALLVPGGIVAAVVQTRNRGDKVPAVEAKQAQAKALVEDSGLAGEWRQYVAEIKRDVQRLEERAAEQAAESMRREDVHRSQIKALYGYAIDLRDHINLGKPPPPPPWPHGIDPSSSTPTQGA